MPELTAVQRQWLAGLGVATALPVEAEPLTGADRRAEGEAKSVSSRKSPPDPSGKRTAVFEVRWVEDGDQFYTRVLAAIKRDAAFKGIPSDQFNAVSTAEPQTLMALVAAFHRSWAMRHSDRKAGQKLKIQFSASYTKAPREYSSSLTGKTLSLVVDAAEKTQPARPTAPVATGAAAMLARFAADADRKGWAGVNFKVKNDGGTTVVTSMERVGSQGARPQGAPELTEAGAAKELENFMATVAEHQGTWDGHFSRDARTGAMLFMKWSKGPDGPKAPPPPAPGRQLSKEEQFELETGVVYPQRINKTLNKVGAKALEEANPFSLQNLPYTIAGVVVPIGAMKLLTMDASQMSIAIRLEWQLDRNLIQQTNAARTAAKVKAPLPTRDLAPGDVIIVPKYGQQRVVSVTPERIVTEPVVRTPPRPKDPAITPIEGHTAQDVLGKKLPTRTHVFEGDQTGGYHSKARNLPTIEQTKVFNEGKYGTYKLTFKRLDKNGKEIPFVKRDGSTSQTKDSTMFPDNMSEAQIMEEVYALMLKHKTAPLPAPNAKGLIEITGKSSRGFDIVVWVAPKGDAQVLITFFPKK